MQLDLFADSADVALGNALITAFEGHDTLRVDAALDGLRAAFPEHRLLAPAAQLLAAWREFSALSGNLTERQRCLETRLLPLAAPLFAPTRQNAWLLPFRRQLAQAATGQPFCREFPERHAAALWQKAGDDDAARRAIEGIASWRRLPVPISWMLSIAWRSGQPNNAWPLLAELAWLDPPRLAALLPDAPKPVHNVVRRFLESFENNSADDDLAWLPAGLLIIAPERRDELRPAQPPETLPGRTFRILCDLLALEKTGQHALLIAKRAHLRAQAPDVFALYMRSR